MNYNVLLRTGNKRGFSAIQVLALQRPFKKGKIEEGKLLTNGDLG